MGSSETAGEELARLYPDGKNTAFEIFTAAFALLYLIYSFLLSDYPVSGTEKIGIFSETLIIALMSFELYFSGRKTYFARPVEDEFLFSSYED